MRPTDPVELILVNANKFKLIAIGSHSETCLSYITWLCLYVVVRSVVYVEELMHDETDEETARLCLVRLSKALHFEC
jgi:hypothetical protein